MYENIYDILLTTKAYILLTIFLIVITIGFIIQILIYPIFFINKKFYRILTCYLLNIITSASLAPVVWNNFNMYSNKALLDSKTFNTNNIYMSNHGGRIDWILSSLFSSVGKYKKLNYIAEATCKYLPLLGWYRNLCEDIYVSRSFNKDGNIIKSNLNSFLNDNIYRDIYFSPEGVIADKNNYDVSMILDCNNFCKKNNFKPFKYVLTPRYKGLQTILNSNNKYYISTVAYFKDNKLMNCKLNDSTREVPDLITLFKYNLDVYIYVKEIKIKENISNEKLKKKLLKIYKKHDKYLKNMDKNKELFYNQRKTDPFIKFTNDVKKKNLYLFFILFILFIFCNRFKLIKYLNKFTKNLFLIVSINHLISKYISGYSRESLPFETSLKAILYRERDNDNKI